MAAPPPSRIVQVLIADDFTTFRGLVRLRLRENGFPSVAEAADGLEAVAKAAELQPDLILLDIAMPKLNGLEAAARIRSVAPQAKILFVSQNDDPDIVRSALSRGALGFVRKAEIGRELLPAIHAALQDKNALR